MAYYLALYSAFIFSTLFIIPLTQSSRCSGPCQFQGLPLDASISSDLCPSSNESNNDINQDCVVILAIDFNSGIVNGRFYARQQSVTPQNQLQISSLFLLNFVSIKVTITYACSMSNYCDFEFVRETLSPALAAIQMEPVRQKLAAILYNAGNTGSVQCSNNSFCPENTLFCQADYTRYNEGYDGQTTVKSECIHQMNDLIAVTWIQMYKPYDEDRLIDIGTFFCNTPNCGSTDTIIETFQWLHHEYILPLNISLMNITTTTNQSTTTTSTIESTTTSIEQSTTTSTIESTTTSIEQSTTTSTIESTTTSIEQSTTTSTTESTTTISTTESTTTISTTESTTTTSTTESTTTTSNYASLLFGHFNILILSFVIILFPY